MSANFWFATAKLLHFFELCKSSVKKNATYVRKYNWRFCLNLNKTHFFRLGGLGEFSRCSQGRLSVKLGNGSRNEKETNLNNCYFLQKIPTALLNGILFSERATNIPKRYESVFGNPVSALLFNV